MKKRLCSKTNFAILDISIPLKRKGMLFCDVFLFSTLNVTNKTKL